MNKSSNGSSNTKTFPKAQSTISTHKNTKEMIRSYPHEHWSTKNQSEN